MVQSQKDNCNDCGHAVPNGANFCPNCGTRLVPKARRVEGGDDGSGAFVPTADAVRIDHEDDAYATPSTNPAAAPAASSPPPGPAATASSATSAPHSTGGDKSTDLSNVQRAIYFKNPTEAMKAQSNHSQKTSAGVMFVRTASNAFSGKFTAAGTIYAGHVMSGDTIDLSLADFVRPVTTIVAAAIMGNVRVIVPQGVRVRALGVGILGEFRGVGKGRGGVVSGEDAPLVVVEGSAIMGKVEVKVDERVPPVLVVG